MNKKQPMYKQIEQYIIKQIRDRAWEPLSKIPSENELAEQFHVSRITVKNALMQLVEKEVVYRLQGKGTFVSEGHHQQLASIEMNGQSLLPNKTIGFLMPRLDNSFTANILGGIEDILSEHGYKLIFSKTNNSQDKEIEKIIEMRQAHVQGLIIYTVEGEHYNNEVLSLKLSNFPLVLVDRVLKGIETNSVSSDNYNAGIEAVKHLHGLAHRTIGFITTKPEGTSSIEDRIAGYEQALQDYNIPINRGLQLRSLDVSSSVEEVMRTVQRFLLANPHMTAVLTSNFNPHVIMAALAAGLRVPEDLSVVFFDDINYPDFALIPPTVLSQTDREIGREAAKLLISQIENNLEGYKQIKLPPTLIVRNSTGVPEIQKGT